MKQTLLGVSALILAFAALAVHLWDRPPKLAYAETSVLLAEFTEAIQARKQFEEGQKEWDRNLKTLNDSLVAAMEAMKKDYDRAAKSEKEKMRALLQQRNEDLQRYTQSVKKMAEDKERELMEPVIKKVNSFLDLWGREHGYDLILGTMTGGNILQANSKLNLTRDVLKDLNSHYRVLPAAAEQKVSKVEADHDSFGTSSAEMQPAESEIAKSERIR